MPRLSRAATARLASSTLVLSRRDIAALMTPGDHLTAVEGAFRALAEGEAEQPAPMHLSGIGGAFHAKGARLSGGHPCAAVKLNANFPNNSSRRGLPTVQGVIALFDPENGRLLALMDSIEITLRRTAAASALAARYLARRESKTIAVCGSGEQGRAHVVALREVLPLRAARFWDAVSDRAKALAREAKEEFGLDARAVATHGEACAGADIIVAATSANKAYLVPIDVAPGTFIAAVGADNPAKSEIAPVLMARSRVVVDVLDQCAAMGDLHHAIEAGVMSPEDVHAELADIVAGRRPGRTSAEEIAIFDSTGIGVQDAASAALAYERARANGVGSSVSLGAL